MKLKLNRLNLIPSEIVDSLYNTQSYRRSVLDADNTLLDLYNCERADAISHPSFGSSRDQMFFHFRTGQLV
jgi:hypothetical protein